jgi:molybdopterin synthase catalytic subunit
VEKINLKLTTEKLDLQSAAQFVESAAAGGTCVFIGTVRDRTKGKTVRGLEFEAYEPMALSEMQKIADTVLQRWPVIRVAMHHRIGHLSIGEVPVIIAVSAAHRKAAFEACQFCIDTLKETVPIWKKEIFIDGEEWVSAHP